MLSNLGPMRLFLLGVALVLTIAAFFANSWYESGAKAELYVTASMVPILLFVILFDVMMNRIQIADKKDQPELQQQYRVNARIEIVVTLVMVLAWWPFFNMLLA